MFFVWDEYKDVVDLELNAIDVLFMHYITDRTEDDVNRYDFWEVQYGRKPEVLLRRLMDAGVIYEDDSLPATLPKLRVFELKHILKSAGLKISGNKPELIKRTLQYATEIDFTAVPLKNVYKLSGNVFELYSETRFMNFFHFNGSFDLHEIYDFYLECEERNSHWIALGFLEGKARHHIHDRNKYTAIKSYFLLSNYALEEMRDIHLSMHYLNHFIMLIVLGAMHRDDEGNPVSPHFYIDAYTKERYRAYMASEKIGADDLILFLTDSTGSLPWSDEARHDAASLITDLIESD